MGSGYDNSLTKCNKMTKLLCSSAFTEYPYELRDGDGTAVLTQRNNYVGCCGVMSLLFGCKFIACCDAAGLCFYACGFPESQCNGKCGQDNCASICVVDCLCCEKIEKKKETKEKLKCFGACGESGECAMCGYFGPNGQCWKSNVGAGPCCSVGPCFIADGECVCFGCCGSDGPCAQYCGEFVPSFCGGTCCNSTPPLSQHISRVFNWTGTCFNVCTRIFCFGE